MTSVLENYYILARVKPPKWKSKFPFYEKMASNITFTENFIDIMVSKPEKIILSQEIKDEENEKLQNYLDRVGSNGKTINSKSKENTSTKSIKKSKSNK